VNGPFEFVQEWYRAQCNGFWEHQYGVTIETLDNPGWMVTIDLAETTLEGRSMEPVKSERSEKDWVICTVEHNKFAGSGDPAKLAVVLEVFRKWAA